MKGLSHYKHRSLLQFYRSVGDAMRYEFSGVVPVYKPKGVRSHDCLQAVKASTLRGFFDCMYFGQDEHGSRTRVGNWGNDATSGGHSNGGNGNVNNDNGHASTGRSNQRGHMDVHESILDAPMYGFENIFDRLKLGSNMGSGLNTQSFKGQHGVQNSGGESSLGGDYFSARELKSVTEFLEDVQWNRDQLILGKGGDAHMLKGSASQLSGGIYSHPASVYAMRLREFIKEANGGFKFGMSGILDQNAEGILNVGIGFGTKVASPGCHASNLSPILVADRICKAKGLPYFEFKNDGEGGEKAVTDFVLRQTKYKKYIVEVLFGKATDTEDALGSVIEVDDDISPITEDKIVEELKSFVGHVKQVPPIYSNKKQDGVLWSRVARRGHADDVQREAVDVHIVSAKVLSVDLPSAFIEVECGPGTYMRALARDLGRRFGSCAYAHNIRRVQDGIMADGPDTLRPILYGGEAKDQIDFDLVNVSGPYERVFIKPGENISDSLFGYSFLDIIKAAQNPHVKAIYDLNRFMKRSATDSYRKTSSLGSRAGSEKNWYAPRQSSSKSKKRRSWIN